MENEPKGTVIWIQVTICTQMKWPIYTTKLLFANIDVKQLLKSQNDIIAPIVIFSRIPKISYTQVYAK